MSSAVDLKTKEEKDAELDKRIEALRKKNEALVKRHQEIQEDKKKAEQEGIAVTTPRRPRPHDPETDRRKMEKENITVTVDLCKPAGVRTGPSAVPSMHLSQLRTASLNHKGVFEQEWEEKRRQNIEKMNEEMERIAEYERGQRADGDKPIRNFLDDPRRSGPAPDMDRKEGSRRHIRNWGGLDFDKVKTGAELEREPDAKGSVDMTMSMTGRERAEYLRWKKEREQIDEERLARHRNATGQWRREWDAQKTENIIRNISDKTSTLHPSHTQVEEKNSGEEGEDDDEWEDASDEEYEEVVEGRSSGEQRTPRPKVHIPPPPPAAALQESSGGAKPPSPFCPLEGHQPVSDWGEEMELLSPRSSMGGESPLKPPSTESSPPQKKDPEEENRTGSCREPQKQHTGTVLSRLTSGMYGHR
uniref:Coiled-coil domain containing 9 n=1 Tax=Nothobranchius furzeri TaxID=105023 RepID=A0A8C6LC40_NOTFU